MSIAIVTNDKNLVVGMRAWGDNEAEDADFQRWALREGYGFTIKPYASFREAERDGWEWES